MNPFSKKAPIPYDAVEERKQVEAELNNRRLVKLAVQSDATEIPLDELDFSGPFGRIIHEPTGAIYFRNPTAHYDVGAGKFDAYTFLEGGLPLFLSAPTGAKTLAEEEELRAARHARNTAPKRKPAWAVEG